MTIIIKKEMKLMKSLKMVKFFRTLLLLVLMITTLTACNDPEDVDDTTEDEKTFDLLDDGEKWKDVSYVYAQDDGNNPLVYVAYDKGDFSDPVLSKDINIDTNPFTKLSLSIKGQYFLAFNIISKSGDDDPELKQSFTLNLSEEITDYEFDLTDASYLIVEDSIIRIEFIMTPGATKHFGNFEVSKLEFSDADMTMPTYQDAQNEVMTNVYNGLSDDFDLNRNWYGLNHLITVREENDYQDIDFSVLPGASVKLTSFVSGDFDHFDYINFTIKGNEGIKLLIEIETSQKESSEVLPTYEMILDGTAQDATLYLDELSSTTINSITKIVIYIEKGTLIPVIGEFEIQEALFSDIAKVDKPVETTNYYPNDNTTFSFNQFWQTDQALTATFEEKQNALSVDYTKQFLTSSIYTNVEGRLSDFDYINISIVAQPYQSFLFQIDTNWAFRMDHHLIADEFGVIEFTMSFGLHYFERDIDAISRFIITPDVNENDTSGSFDIVIAEFSQTALVDYEVTEAIEINDFRQIGDIFDIDSDLNQISFESGDGFKSLYARVYGQFITNNHFYYRYIYFDAVVTEDIDIEFEVDGAKYALTLTPNETVYRIDLNSPSSGTADAWKFSDGFNIFLHIDITQSGQFELSTLTFSNESEAPVDVIDFNQELSVFNNMTATSLKKTSAIETTYEKTQYNSLVYFLINDAIKDGKTASDYTYINLSITSDYTTEFLIELSGSSAMTYYEHTLENRMDLTIVLDSLMLPSQIDALQYINITPMPNEMDASGSFNIEVAEFSNQALVAYDADISFQINEFNEIGSVFDITDQTINWVASGGYKSLMHRMNGSYSDDESLDYQYLSFEATVLKSTVIEFDIVNTKYSIELTPGQIGYQIDLTAPTSGNADLWKFSTGFNLILSIDTTISGEIVFGDFMLGN